MKLFDFKDNKTFRSYIEKIRKDSFTFQMTVSSVAGRNGGYFIASSEKEKFDCANKMKQRGIMTIKTSSIIKNHPHIGQVRILFEKLFGGKKYENNR